MATVLASAVAPTLDFDDSARASLLLSNMSNAPAVAYARAARRRLHPRFLEMGRRPRAAPRREA